MVSVVVISKNQRGPLEKMLAALRSQLPDYPRLFVLDRTTDGSREFLMEEGERFVEKNTGRGFEAGSARNLGLSLVPASDDVLFFDGDRHPIGISPALVEQALATYDVTLISAEKELCRGWFTDHFTENPLMGFKGNSFFTCGFLMRRSAIQEILKLSMFNLLFNPLYDGAYGTEDMFLGDMVYHIGLSCGGFPISCRVNGEVGVMDEEYKAHRSKEQWAMRDGMRALLRVREEVPPPMNARALMKNKLAGRA